MDQTFKVRFDPTNHQLDPAPVGPSDQPEVQVSLEWQPEDAARRHQVQCDGLPPDFRLLPDGQALTPIPLEQRHIKVTVEKVAGEPVVTVDPNGSATKHTLRSGAGEPIFTKGALYLFNVIVALEWQPSARTRQHLIRAFQQASNLLYDVTDGQMALGQVVIGDARFMACADVQVLASNRYYPRSWVNGLTEEQKYTPVRLGRGWWRKDLNIDLPWSDPVGARVIVHEWCHYALGLLDEYLVNESVAMEPPSAAAPARLVPIKSGTPVDPAKVRTVVVVRPGLASDSIMDNLEGSSELVPQGREKAPKRREKLGIRLKAKYRDIDLSGPVLEGPDELPLDLPVFPAEVKGEALLAGAPAHEERRLRLPHDSAPEHTWAYLLRPDGNGAWQRVVPQGTLDARAADEGFWLYGYRAGDELCLISTQADGTVQVLRTPLVPVVDEPDAVTFAATLAPQPLPVAPVVTVVPLAPGQVGGNGELPNTEPVCKITLRVANLPENLLQDPTRLKAWVFPAGETQSAAPLPPRTAVFSRDNSALVSRDDLPFDVPSLDGQVLLAWDGQILIAEYSEGGGPATSIRAPEPPISAGSSEGNLMFYCSEYEKATTPELEKQISDMRLAHSRLRIVTTRNYGEFAGVTQNQIKPRSYLFSAAAVGGLPVNDLHPTVTFSFDPSAVGSDGGALFVYTYHEADGVWRLKPTYQQPFVTRASHPLEPGTGNAALDPLDHPAYYYRLFLVPGDGQPPEQVGPAPDPMP